MDEYTIANLLPVEEYNEESTTTPTFNNQHEFFKFLWELEDSAMEDSDDE